MTSFLLVPWAIDVTGWVLAFAVGVFLYWKLRLRTIPWVLAFFLVGLAAAPVSMWFRPVLEEWVAAETFPFQVSAADFVIAFGVATSVLGSAADFMVALLLLSEVVFLASNLRTAPDLGPMKRLLVVRDKVRLLGPALIVLAISRPALLVALYAVGP